MYLDALEFLEEERDAWAPYEALAAMTDDELERSVDGAHGWSGRDLIAHMLAWQGIALDIAQELAVNETSPTIARIDAEWAAKGDVFNDEIQATWAALPMTELRERLATQPGDLRGYLTVVPETRWVKNADHLKTFHDDTIAHYEEHLADLAAILAAASS
jgi:Mycothiol maleylpyruvate isomerase N-terminal domain